MSIEQIIQQALRSHRAGQLAAAERAYRQVLAAEPNHPLALGLLGVVAHQCGSHEAAEELISRSLRLAPRSAGMHNNLGMVQLQQGRAAEARASFQRAIELNPADAAPWNNLGNACVTLDLAEEAIRAYRRAIELKPDYADALTNLGALLMDRGQSDAAIELHRRALDAAPDWANAHVNLGCALAKRDPEAAAAHLRRAIELNPGAAAAAYANLGLIEKQRGRPSQGVALHQRAIELIPKSAALRNNLSQTLLACGRVAEAVEMARSAVATAPTASAGTGLLWALNHDIRATPEEIFDEHRRWGQRHADPLAPAAATSDAHRHDWSPDRRLRIGYLSADLRQHPVSFFVEPVLESHDHEAFHVTCYFASSSPDAVTDRLRGRVDRWCDIAGMADAAAAELIRQDEIDILVELGGHTAGSRLLVAARRPAPLQVSWIGYPNTTGVRAIDHWITDAHLDPPGETERYATENLLRLPETFTCYRPPESSPPLAASPALSAGHVTFGSFNNVAKLNDEVVDLWSQVMDAVPRSRLLLATPALNDPDVYELVAQRFEQRGIARDRLEFCGAQRMEQYLNDHARVDVALDPFPFTGHTSSMHALWMGVPLITLAGRTHIARRGVSILANLGLDQFIARTPAGYVQIASRVAADVGELQALRQTLRDRMRDSALLRADRFTHRLELAYREIWRRRCSQGA